MTTWPLDFVYWRTGKSNALQGEWKTIYYSEYKYVATKYIFYLNLMEKYVGIYILE